MSPIEYSLKHEGFDKKYITHPSTLNNSYIDVNEKMILSSKYYDSFEFKFNDLSDSFKLINPNEIYDFILLNDDLFDYLDRITYLLHEYFYERKYYLEFSLDPEISNLSQLVLYVESNEVSFDEDWDLLRNLNKKIIRIDEFPSTLKRLVSVDLW